MSSGRLEDVILRGLAAARPAANAVATGTLYFSSDTEVTERSNGTSWDSYAAAPASGGITQLTSDVTAGPGSGSQVATIAGHAISNTKFRQSAATSVVGNATGSTADVADIAAGADDRVLARTAGALSFAQVTAGMLPSHIISDAKLRQGAADSVIGNATGSTADVADIVAAADDRLLARTSGTLSFVQVTAGMLPSNIVTDAKLRQGAADSVIGNATGSTANVADIVAAADDRLLARTGGTLSFVQVTVGMLPNDVVTYAKVQNVSATSRILGRKTSGAGDIEECTLSEILDFISSAAQGDILFRGASAWSRLAAGTSGNFLKTNGAGADPSWASAGGGGGSNAYTLIATPTVTGTNIDVTGLSTTYDEILVIFKGVTFGSGAIAGIRVSTDNGATFLAASGDYIGISGAGVESNTTLINAYSTAVTTARSAAVRITPFKTSGSPKVASAPFFSTDAVGQQLIATTSALNAIRLTTSSAATWTGGTIYVLGR